MALGHGGDGIMLEWHRGRMGSENMEAAREEVCQDLWRNGD